MTRDRIGSALLLFTALACAHTPSVVTDGDRFDLSSRQYPQFENRADTLLSPRRPLTTCADSGHPGWPTGVPTWPSPRIPQLAMRLPPGFEGVDLTPAVRMIRQSGFNADG